MVPTLSTGVNFHREHQEMHISPWEENLKLIHIIHTSVHKYFSSIDFARSLLGGGTQV